MKSAYWNIIKSVGWDVDYSPGKYIGIRSDNLDFPFPDDKLARNILVSTGLPRTSQVWTGKTIITTKPRNPLYNGILWCLAQDVLNSIAHDMVSAGAIYVHTDGYIFNVNDVQNAWNVAAEWGIQLGVKYAGFGEVFGVSNYWIEGKPTRRMRRTPPKPHTNIQPAKGHKWLRQWWKYYEKNRLL